MALPAWNAHPNCPAHLRGAIEQRIRPPPLEMVWKREKRRRRRRRR
jgi:hypothetical protein